MIKDDIRNLADRTLNYIQTFSKKLPRKTSKKLTPYSFLGDLQFELRDYENSLLYYQKALIIEPDDLNAIEKMIWAFIYTEQFDKALKIAEKMVKIDPNNYKGHMKKAHVLYYQGKLDKSIEVYTKALNNTKENSVDRSLVLSGRSNVYLIAEKWEKALQDANEAYRINPNDLVTLLNKANALKHLGKVKVAKRILNDKLKQITSKYDNYIIACTYALLENKAKMIKHLKLAIDADIGMKALAKIDPDFKDFRDDADFLQIINGSLKKQRKKI